MKTHLLVVVFLLFIVLTKAQNIGVNTSGATPNLSALLDIDATGLSPKLGLLIPRFTFAERTGIITLLQAAQGLVVYQTDGVQGFYYNTSTTTTPAWSYLSDASSSWTTAGNTLTGTLPVTPNEWIGSINAADWIVKTNNAERMRVNSTGNIGIGTIAPAGTFLATINPTTGAIPSGISIPMSGATSTAYGIDISANNQQINGVRVVNSSTGTSNAFSAVSGILTATNIVSGYLGYRTNGGLSYGLFGINGTNATYAANASTWAAFIEGRAVISSEASPTSALGTDLEIRNTTTGAGVPATVSLRQTLTNAAAATNLAVLNFGDNNQLTPQAQISVVRGAVSSGAADLPTDIVFSNTPDGSATLTERMRILNNGNVGIGTVTPNASALLDIESATKGLLIPQVILTGANAAAPVTTPLTSLLVYNTATVGTGTTSNDLTLGYYYWNGAKWISLSGGVTGNNWSITGNAGTTPGTNFLGTTDAKALEFKVKNTKAGYIDYNAALANTAFGYQAENVTTGANNTAVGYQALVSNTIGTNNTAVGYQALWTFNSSGGNNTALGYKTLRLNAGSDNIAVGYQTLYQNTGSQNTGIGSNALGNNLGGSFNVAVGYYALNGFNTTSNATNNVAVGTQAGYYNTSGNDNVFVGNTNGYNNSTGSSNVFIGNQSGNQNTTGSTNVFMGYQSGYFNLTGGDNVYLGSASGYNNSSGGDNVFIGSSAGVNSSGGTNNVFIGTLAGAATTTSANTFVGEASGIDNTSGTANSFFGTYAGLSNVAGSYNTYIGESGTELGEYSNASSLGYDAWSTASNQIVIGNGSVSSIGGSVGWTNFSDSRVKNNVQENIPGLDFIKALRPVTFHYDLNKENKLLGRIDKGIDWEGKHDIEKIAFSGFIAQEVDSAASKIGYNFSGVDKLGKIWGLRYTEFIPSLVKAIQEQQKIIDEQNKKMDSLNTIIIQQQQTNSEQNKSIEQLKEEVKNIQTLLNNNNALLKTTNMSNLLFTDKK